MTTLIEPRTESNCGVISFYLTPPSLYDVDRGEEVQTNRTEGGRSLVGRTTYTLGVLRPFSLSLTVGVIDGTIREMAGSSSMDYEGDGR